MGLYRREQRKSTEIKENVVSQNMKESSTEAGSVRCGRMDLGLKLYSSLSLCASISALTPGRLHALQLSLPPHATPFSTTPLCSLFPSLLPSQEVRQHEWQAGAGGGIWGLLAKRQTGADPLEFFKWQTLKGVGGDRKR